MSDEEENTFDEFDELLKRCGFEHPTCHSHVDKGWWPILEPLLKDLKAAGVVTLGQVKEKFGGLRVYVDEFADVPDDTEMREYVSKRIAEAEALCWRTCESCGQTGAPRSRGWVKVRCDKCQAASEAARGA